MQILTTIADMRHACRKLRGNSATLALVPTMGAIHEGHLSLVHRARAEADIAAASIFVNPLQFAPTEDLDRYPRPFDDDCRKLAAAGVDLLFAPSAEEMYPANVAATFVEVPGLSDRLDGASRPGHFRGVATVVAKLLNIVQPDVALFGQKDAAQLAVLRAMVRDLDLPVRILACPIVRDTDGLALSSRNRYLTSAERHEALAIPAALRATAARIEAGETSASTLRTHLTHLLAGIRIDYATIVDPNTLLPVDTITHGALIAIAAYIGTTRLIDNLLIEPQQQPTYAEPEEALHA